MFGWRARNYRPDPERIKRLKPKYSRYLEMDRKTMVVYHKFYVNGKLSKLKLVNINNIYEKKINFLDRTNLGEYSGLYWTNKKAITTWFAKFNVDILAADRFGNIIDIMRNIEPNSFTKYHSDGWLIIVLPKGMLNVISIMVGDNIKIWKRKKQYK